MIEFKLSILEFIIYFTTFGLGAFTLGFGCCLIFFLERMIVTTRYHVRLHKIRRLLGWVKSFLRRFKRHEPTEDYDAQNGTAI